MLKSIALAGAGLGLATSEALANTNCKWSGTCAAVPEISALEGTAAIAAVFAVMALVWERRRRAA